MRSAGTEERTPPRRGAALNLVAALPEIHLLPHHCAPHTEEPPQVVGGAPVEGVFIGTTVPEVGDAVARHELPGGGVERDQVEVRAQEQQHHQRQQSHHNHHSQEQTVGVQPRAPRGCGVESSAEDEGGRW